MTHETLVAMAVFDTLCGCSSLLIVATCARITGWQRWMWVGLGGAVVAAALGWGAALL